jgi:hypothetical protein
MERAKGPHSFEVVVDPHNPSHLQIELNGLSRDPRVAERMRQELAKDERLKVHTNQDENGEVTLDIANIAYLSSAHTAAAFGYIALQSVRDIYPNTEVSILDTHHRVPDTATNYPIRRSA